MDKYAASRNTQFARKWVAGYLAFAVLTAVIVNNLRATRLQQEEQVTQRVAQIKAAGGEAYTHGRVISGLRLPPDFTDDRLAELSDMKQLGSLTLRDTLITDQSVAQLRQFPNLSYLDISGTRVTDQGLSNLHSLKRLASIDLSRLSVSAQAVTELLEQLPRVNTVSLADLGLTDANAIPLSIHHAVSWNMSGNQLTDAGLENFWRIRRNFLHLDISRNPIRGAIFSEKPNTQYLNLTIDQVPIDDAALIQLLSHGVPISLELGQTQVSVQGLERILNTATAVTLKEGSFDEGQLAGIPPVTALSLSSLSLNSTALTGQFLSNWRQLPQALSFAKSAMTDRELASLPNSFQPTHSLNLSDCPITDASLEKIEELNPRSLILWNTRVTAKGLLQSKLQKTLIFLNQDQFTPAQWKQLIQSMNISPNFIE